MKVVACFQPHLRLIYLFLGSFLISGIPYSSLLWGLNVGLFCGWFYLLCRSQQPLIPPLKRWAKLHYFSVLLFGTLSWQITPTGISFNAAGLNLALLITLRMNAVLLLTRLMLWQINEIKLVQAVGKLPISAKLIQLLILTIRYISLLGQLNGKMYRAMQARGYRAGFNRRTFKITAQRVSLLLIHAYAQLKRSEMALKARAFRIKRQTSHRLPYALWLTALVGVLMIGYL
ncbi:energy-coupling factor transporter transmembrane component T family protein [Muribacter muris]|uniref:energy-coupling factor transporter transmembrane component T family protein n=1 Tax=Muribacter muris TaxID=67855 RepID=UPI00064DDBED|nr:energy-coupling factor transporter transmembrane component T [Muribacter muris]